jgi:hypothetical protein
MTASSSSIHPYDEDFDGSVETPVLKVDSANKTRKTVGMWTAVASGLLVLAAVFALTSSQAGSVKSSKPKLGGNIKARSVSADKTALADLSDFADVQVQTAAKYGSRSHQRTLQANMLVDSVPTTAPVTFAPTSTFAPTTTVDADEIHCGCPTCTLSVWRNVSGTPERTCGQRVKWLLKNFPRRFEDEQEACRQVAFEFPCECGGCDPNRCDIAQEPFKATKKWAPPKQEYVPYKVKFPSTMYCFPPDHERTTWYQWGGMKVQPKQSADVCGPGFNKFSNETAYEKDGELYLTYSNQQASEVRVTLPNDQLFNYGKYTFSIKSVSVLDAAGQVVDDKLPNDLVLGLFTWDDTDNYAIHENFNHEVDIEISRWGCEENADAQFLVQPAGYPQMDRFYSGAKGTYDQGGHVYSFNWLPNRIDWETTAGGGQTFSLTSEMAQYKRVPDFVQCMPSGYTEIRMNLWNMNGPEIPTGIAPTDTVQVVIDKFSYEPATVAYAADGDFCSKSCQCSPASECWNGRCTSLVEMTQ